MLDHSELGPGGASAPSWTVTAERTTSYRVSFCPDLLAPGNDTLESVAFAGSSRRRIMVVDDRVYELFGAELRRYLAARGLRAEIVRVPGGEHHKDLRTLVRLAEDFDGFLLDRRAEPIVALGGGTVLDMVGFAAGVYRRGTPYVRIPTTLIGLVDAGVGVKTGLNHNGHKNRLGSYHAPTDVLLDPAFLRTLPVRHVRNGLAEIAKIALACDADLWHLLGSAPESLVASHIGTVAAGTADAVSGADGREVLRRAVHAILLQLHGNLWEDDLQRLADFGHTFSPALEMRVPDDVLHGEAVAVDMSLCVALAHGRWLLSTADRDAILETFGRLGLRRSHPAVTAGLLADALAETTRHRGGRQRIPVPVEPGRMVFLDDVEPAELIDAARVTAGLPDKAAHAIL